MRSEEFTDLFKSPPSVKVHDLAPVAWYLYLTTPDNVEVTLKNEPTDKFVSQAKAQWAVFKRKVSEKRKVESMIISMNASKFSLPIYVGAYDPNSQIVEGRHRLCAYWLSGTKILPVAYVSKI